MISSNSTANKKVRKKYNKKKINNYKFNDKNYDRIFKIPKKSKNL